MGVKIDLKPGSDRAFYNHVDEKVITLPNGVIIGTPILDVLPCDDNDCKIDTNIIPHEPVKIDYNTTVNNKPSINGVVLQGDLTTEDLHIDIVEDSLLYVDARYNLTTWGFQFESCSHFYDEIAAAYNDNKIIKTRLIVHNSMHNITTVVTVDVNFIENDVAYFFPLLVANLGSGLKPYLFRLVIGKRSCNLDYWEVQTN